MPPMLCATLKLPPSAGTVATITPPSGVALVRLVIVVSPLTMLPM